jgi:peptidoglycan/LPS O-acetylase OafA/YrhL
MEKKPDSPGKTHFARIDVLRGIAILWVFFYHHYSGLYSEEAKYREFIQHWPLWLRPWSSLVMWIPKMGHLGVQLFFVISGFCIHASYLSWRRKNQTSDLRRFYPYFFWRRFWRIVPPNFASLLVSYWTVYADPLVWSSLRKLLLSATLLKTLFPGYFFSINYAHWSVAVEWQLYLVYPLVLILALRVGVYRMLLITGLVAFLLRFVAPHLTSSTFLLNLPFAWWLEWTLGALVAEQHARGKNVIAQHGWLVLALAIAASLSAERGFPLGEWLATRVLFAVLLEAVLLKTAPLRWWERALVPIGLCSYSIYLFHLPLMTLGTKYLLNLGMDLNHLGPWLLAGLILLVPTLIFSWFSYKWLELGNVRLGEIIWGWRRGRIFNRSPASAS